MPKYFDLRGFPSSLAKLVVSGAITIGALASLNFASGIPQGVLFLDGSRNASSSANFIFDSTVPSSGAGMMALGVGATTSSNAIFTIDGNNGTNVYGLRLLDQGAGTSGFRYDLSANGDLHIDTSSNIYSGTDFRIGTTNRPLRIQVNSSAFNSGSPYGMDFDVLALPTKVSFQFNGSDGQVADLFNIYNNSASSSPVFAINSQGKTAIGFGASTSTSAQLSVSGITSSTLFSAGAGSVSSPAINFSGAGESNTGLYVDAGGRMAVAVDGVLEATWYSTHFEVNDDILPASSGALDLGSTVRYFRNGFFSESVSSTIFMGPAGSNAAPTYTFNNDSDTGLYNDTTNSASIAAGSNRLLTVRSNGVFLGSTTVHLQPFSDNVTDIGISGNRFNDAWFGGTVTTTNLNVASSSAATATYYVCANAAGDIYKKTTACN